MWAEALYIEMACALQSITREQFPSVAYRRLQEAMPPLPGTRFSNGGLWPDNSIVRDGRLAGVIDWANAGFSDPVFEFLLPSFLRPGLRGRGIEARYSWRMGLDPGILPWCHGLELFDAWRWVLVTGEPYEQRTAKSLQADLACWLEEL